PPPLLAPAPSFPPSHSPAPEGRDAPPRVFPRKREGARPGGRAPFPVRQRKGSAFPDRPTGRRDAPAGGFAQTEAVGGETKNPRRRNERRRGHGQRAREQQGGPLVCSGGPLPSTPSSSGGVAPCDRPVGKKLTRPTPSPGPAGAAPPPAPARPPGLA